MRLVDLFVRLGADTSSMERGMAGAQKALAGFERASTTAGAGSDKLLASLDENGKRLLDIAQKTGGATKGLNELTQIAIKASGGMEKYTAIVAAMNAEAGKTAQVVHVQASAFSKIDVEAGKGRLAVGRLSSQFGSLAASAAGVHPALTNLAGVLGGFAVGGLVTAGVLAGLAALTLAYRHFTSESREAQKASEDFSKALQDQAKAARLATVAGQQGLKILAENEMDRAQEALRRAQAGRTVFDPATGGMTKRIVDTQAVAAAQRDFNIALENFTTQSKNVEDAIEAADDAGGEYGETLNSLASLQDRAAKAATGHTDAILGLAAALRGMPGVDAVAALGAGATAGIDIERERREREFAPGSDAFKRQVDRNQFARDLGRDALDPMRREREIPGLELGMDMKKSLDASNRQISKLDEVKNAIVTSGALMQAAMIALGDKILIGGGGAGSRTGGGIGGLIGGALGGLAKGTIGALGLGGPLGIIAGTLLGSAIGGMFDKPEKAIDSFTDSVERATASMGNIPDWVRVNSYRYAAAGAGMTTPAPMDTRPSTPINFNGPVTFTSGAKDLEGLRREVRREITAGGLGLRTA